MKKITLMVAAFLFAMTATFAQQGTIDFESYTLGDIDGQSDNMGSWSVQTDGGAAEVTDVEALSGDQSLIVSDDGQGTMAGIGLTTTPNSGVYKFSFNVYISSDYAGGDGQMSFSFDTSDNGQSAALGRLAVFAQDDKAYIGYIQGQSISGFDAITLDDWNEVTMIYDIDNGGVVYAVNGSALPDSSTGDPYVEQIPGGYSIEALSFVAFDADDMYIDDISLEEMDLGVEEHTVTTFNHYVNNNQLFLNSDSQIGDVAIFNLLGQEVSTSSINDANGQVDLSGLSSGVYIAKVAVNGQIKSFKFVK